ncbi:hypothetical protein K435DRAFT_777901 [Dendrothele bispora CBS 962.96]|uniref:Cytochrome b-c1 complex subunit 8 n=1 Tax=Dendrothele bispora (strain CBS 962.96) TaxID=1314807 RepID=A0A4S8M5U7_DENBC|nr:hypothetical protein K435DRAFT_777901 [Dendrothele bispora CBS 962.96]
MRPSITRYSEMPGPRHSWNKWWGDTSLQKHKGMTTYTISPFQTKAAPKFIRTYVFNAYRRISAEAVYFVVPFAAGYGIYTWAKSRDAWQNSKAGHIASGEHH